MSRMEKRVLVLLAIVALAACGPGSSSGTGGGGSTSTGTQSSVCASDPRAMQYAVGLSQTSTDGKVKIAFADASPAPPAKGANVWTITVTDGAQMPIDGATITVKPFMPDHGHGSSAVPKVTGKGSGSYEISNLELFMPGIWQITFTVTPAGGAAESVVFTFCVEG
jgi:hypothetical protein